MWSKYANATETVRKTPFERIMIMMKDPTSKKDADAFIRDLRQSITVDADKSLRVYNYLDSQKTLA